MATEALLEKGIQNYRQENYEEALDLLQKARESLPASSTLAYYLGLTYKQTGNYPEAAAYFREAAKGSPAVKEAYPDLIEVLYHLGELGEAKDWIARAEKERVSPALISFLKGLVLVKEDKNKQALEAFEKAKELDASLRQAAEFQIALARAKERKYQQARESLKAVMAIDPGSDISAFARDYDQALGQVLSAHKTWGGSFGLGYQYDDNPVLKPSGAIPGVVIFGEADSSILATFRVYYNPLWDGPWLFNAQYGIYSNTYFHTSSHNLINQTLSLNPGLTIPKGTISVPMLYSHVWLQGAPYQGVFAVKPTWSFITFRDHLGQLSAGYARRDVIQAPLMEDEDRDGNLFLGSAGYMVPFWERGVLSLYYEYSRDLTTGRNWENTGHRFSLNLLIPLTKTVSITLSGEFLYQDYPNTNSVFEVKRLDKTYSGTVGLVWEAAKNLHLNLQYYGARAESNIAIYDYRRNVVTLGMEYHF